MSMPRIHLSDMLFSVFSVFNWELRDHRNDGLPLMGSWWPTWVICGTYVYLVTIWGPYFMKNKSPYNLRGFLILYNSGQVIFNALLFGLGLHVAWWGDGYSFRCQPIRRGTFKSDLYARLCYYYFLNKFVDFIDTFVFVARKKFQHISVLHVFHHASMPITSWIGVRFYPGGHGTFFGLVNTFIHIWMYTYYAVAAMGPQYSKWIWWKKHLTQMQLFQFALILIHAFQLFFIDCDFPIVYAYLIIVNAVIFIVLFARFYVVAYTAKTLVMKDGKSSTSFFETSSSQPNIAGKDHARFRRIVKTE